MLPGSALALLLVIGGTNPAASVATEGASNLADCLTQAEQANPDILRQKEIIAENIGGYRFSRGALLPQIDATMSYQRYDEQLPSKKAIFGSSLNDYYSDVAIKQRIFSGGKYFAQMSAAKLSTEAERQRLEQLRRDVAMSVTKAYYDQLRAQYALDIQKSVLEKLKQQRIVAQLLYNGGKTTVVDVLKIQTNESAQEDAVRDAANEVYVKALALGQAIGVRNPVAAVFVMPETNSDVHFEKELSEEELASNPEIRYAGSIIEKNAWEVKSYKAEHYPDFYLKGAYFREDRNMFPGNANWYAGAYVSLPLFRGGSLRAQVDKAKARQNQAKETSRKTMIALYARYASALSTVLNRKDRIATSQATLALAKETLTASELRYSGGKISVLDLLDAQNLWSGAYMTHINAVFDYLISATELKSIWPDSIKGDLLK